MMKRKNVSGLISVLLCLSFLAGAFAACGKKDETDPSHEEEYDGLVVFAEGKETDFKVVRGETAPKAETDAAKNLRVELIALSGKEIAIATDYVGRNDPDPTDAFEILVGKTKRPESQTAYEALEKQLEKDGLYDGYGVAVIGHKIAVVGTSERMLRLACERFADLFDGAELRLPNGFAQYTSQKSVTPDDYFTSDAGYRLDPDPQKRIATIGVVGGFNVCQGYCSDGKFFYVGLIDKKKSPETIRLEKRLLTTGELVLALDELQRNASICKWMVDLVIKLVRLGTIRGPVLIPLQRNVVKHLVVALLSDTPTYDVEVTATLEPHLILLLAAVTLYVEEVTDALAWNQSIVA